MDDLTLLFDDALANDTTNLLFPLFCCAAVVGKDELDSFLAECLADEDEEVLC